MAMPVAITVKSSDRVMRSTQARTSSGASVMPTKMFATAARLSAPEVPMVRDSPAASARTTTWTTPRW